MRSLATTARFSGVVAATAALLGLGTMTAGTAMAEERPIDPADAPEIMERPWPEYEAGEKHSNIWVVSNILTVETDDSGEPYWDEEPTDEFTDELSEAVAAYQTDEGLGDHGNIKEELWGHFSDVQFSGEAAWGPGDGRGFYTIPDTGEGVENIQEMLINQGHLDEDDKDGIYGQVTEEAVLDFQGEQVCGVAALSEPQCQDGLVGVVTWRALVTTG